MREVGDIRQSTSDKCRPVGQRVAAVAERQFGVVAAWQLRELGWNREAIRRETARGFLHRVHHGVYAVGHAGLNPNGVLMAALLAGGPGAVLNRRSAAAVWDLQQAATPVPEVAVPRSRRGRRSGIRMQRVRLSPVDVTTHGGFPVTTVTRTLVDMAAVTSPQRLEKMWEAALRRDLVDMTRLTELCQGRRGARHLRALAATATMADPARSELERLFYRRCARHGLPPPTLNTLVEGLEVDAYWHEARLVVELDSWEFHRTRAAFERDRARDAKLVAAGLRVMRFTWRQLQGDEAWARLSRALRRP